MSILLGVLNSFSILQARQDDDFIDRLNYYFTSTLLIACSILVSFKQFGGHPLECWVENEFSSAWEQYAGMFKVEPCAAVLERAVEVLTSSSAVRTYFNRDRHFGKGDYYYNSIKRTQEDYEIKQYHKWCPLGRTGDICGDMQAETYCWAQDTYYVPIEEELPVDHGDRKNREISYYQWTPYFFLIQASMFYLPCMIWRLMHDNSGFNLVNIVALVSDKENINPDKRKANVAVLAKHMHSVIDKQNSVLNRENRFLRCFNLRFSEAYVTILYIMIKILYSANVLFQLFLLNWFLQTDRERGGIFGFNILKDLLTGGEWESNGNFPRVTLCDFEIRTLGNVQQRTCQCVLVINILNEKIFIFLWMWFCILATATVASLLYWLVIGLFETNRRRFLLRHLDWSEEDICSSDTSTIALLPSKGDARKRSVNLEQTASGAQKLLTTQPSCKNYPDFEEFRREFIKIDGIFVLRMVAMHVGALTCSEVVEQLWANFTAAKRHASHKAVNGWRLHNQILSGTHNKTLSVDVGTGDDDIDGAVAVSEAGMRTFGDRSLNRSLTSVIQLRGYGHGNDSYQEFAEKSNERKMFPPKYTIDGEDTKIETPPNMPLLDKQGRFMGYNEHFREPRGSEFDSRGKKLT